MRLIALCVQVLSLHASSHRPVQVQGTGDRQTPEVGAVAMAGALPGCHLHVVEGGGHFAFWSGNQETRRQMLQELFASGRQV